jgi:hypothetical protein
MGFPKAAHDVFEFDTPSRRGGSRTSDVLLEITPISSNADVHTIVDRVQGQAGSILSSKLGYPASAVLEARLPGFCGHSVLGHALGGLPEHH